MCVCSIGYSGDPFTQCSPIQQTPVYEQSTPCSPSPCGSNAFCREQNRAGACQCLSEYVGNPYEGCRPECVLNSDCQSNRACISNKCADPCPGTCGQNAVCQVMHHLPSCSCNYGHTGDPYRYCSKPQDEPPAVAMNPCQPTPCGPNSQCREVNTQAVCSCLPTYIGSPPGCRPECVLSSECPSTKACVNQKCIDPCTGACGSNAMCRVNNHSPICFCDFGLTGNPNSRCYQNPPRKNTDYFFKLKPIDYNVVVVTAATVVNDVVAVNPCYPSPCGPHSQCQPSGQLPSCSCLPSYFGTPPNCRPECSINSDCVSNRACLNERCRDPCPGSCGLYTRCNVNNHTPICTCIEGYIGDPFISCYTKPSQRNFLVPYENENFVLKIPSPAPVPVADDPCNPTPCGLNAKCNDGVCSCIPEYNGDPYVACRPECVLNSDCPRIRACIRNKCIDPCPGTCGQSAICDVINHVPMCTCQPGFEGNAFAQCRPVQSMPISF